MTAVVRIDSLFDVRNGNSLTLTRMKRAVWPEGVNFVNRARTNNGVAARVLIPEGEAVWPEGTITVALSGSVLSTFVQPDRFVTAFHVAVLIPKQDMTLAEKLWRSCCIEANRYRYNYGRQANRTLGELEVPATPPAWIEDVPKTAVNDLWRRIRTISSTFDEPTSDELPLGRDDRITIDVGPEDALRARPDSEADAPR